MPRQDADNRRKSKQPAKLSVTSILVVVVLAVLAVGALALFTGTLFGIGLGGGSAPTDVGTSKGPADAKVQIEEFADFQCPYCATFASTQMRQIEQEYVATGLVRVTFRHFAFLGNKSANDESILAGEAAECAAEQGRFWSYSDKVFASQAGENRGAFSKSNLKRFARDLGLDTKNFDACLDTDKHRAKVVADTEEGRKRGVTGTPTTFVNGQMVKGVEDFPAIKKIIDAQLAK